MNNLFGTASPIPFRVIDQNIGLDLDTSLRCNGEYSFHLVDPLLFYKNVCGNVTESYTRSELVAKMKAELLTALQPAIPGPPATGPFRTTATNRSRFSMETAPGSLAWS